MNIREAAQMALDALEHLQTDIEWQYKSPTRAMLRKVEKAIHAALAQPEQEPITKMREMLEVQGRDGNWNYDAYMHGMYNGMEFMMALAEGREPVFRDPPEKWLYATPKQPEQEPPCKTGSQCVGGKCERCAVQEPWGYISHRSWKMPVFVEADDLEVSGLPFNNPDYTPVYKAPPQREWQGLTEQEHMQIAIDCGCASADWVFYGAAVERKLREKNT